MNDRPLCTKCNIKLCAINYRKNEKVYYRRLCDSCIRHKKMQPKEKLAIPKWQLAGYTKHNKCEKCGFLARFDQQLVVHPINGNLKDTDFRNLRTICSNCQIELTMSGVGWAVAQARSLGPSAD